MSRVLLFTPDPSFAERHHGWRRAEAPLRALLEREGHQVAMRPWTTSDPPEFDLALPLLAWGYHVLHDRWLEQTTAWAQSNICILNPPRVLAWNSDKRYLRRLEERGVRCVPTCFVDHLSSADLRAAAESFGTERLVVKPVLGGGAHRTLRIGPDGDLNEGPDGPALIQPYLASVETEGELSLLFFNGSFSHAVIKKPSAGDFRVQADFGGSVIPFDPPNDAMEAAQQILAAAGGPLLYARVDMVRDFEGLPALMELEAIEPELFLQYAPDYGRALLDAVSQALE